MSGTSPDSVAYARQFYGLLGPTPSDYTDVTELGAVGDGITDDTVAIQRALDDAADGGGGAVYFPGNGRRYRISSTLIIGSNTTLWSDSFARLVPAPYEEWTQSPRGKYLDGNSNIAIMLENAANEYPTVPAVPDTNITLRGLIIDYATLGSGGSGSCSFFFRVNGLNVENCQFYAGPSSEVPTGRIGDAIASLGCSNVRVVGCRAYWFRNCAYDFWSAPTNVQLIGNYAESFDSVQMVNFNPDWQPPFQTAGAVARGLVMVGNTLVGTGATARPCQIEPLYSNTLVRDVMISNNRFDNVYLVLRGDTSNVTITGNTFDGYPDPNTNVIRAHANLGGQPSAFSICDNTFLDPGTNSTNNGVIVCQMDDAVVTGNVITGTTYTGGPFYSGTNRPNQFGNYFEKPGVTGRMRQGFVISNADDPAEDARSCVGWEDSGDDPLRMYMSGDFFGFFSTDGTGAPRQVWSLQARNSTSQINFLIGMVVSGLFRKSTSTALTAAGSTQANALGLVSNYNEVTTVALNTGVRLPSGASVSVAGLEVTVWNQGANTLNVYPPTSAQIDALGINIPDTIAAGACKTYVGLSSTQYRIKT